MKNHSDIWDIMEEKSPAYFDLIDTTDVSRTTGTMLHSWHLIARDKLPAAPADHIKRITGIIYINPAPDDVQPARTNQFC